MSIEVERATVACNACGAQVTELRRGRCWACYMKWAEMRPVPRGAMCALCTDRRRENLRLVELCGRSVSLCHLCAARVHKLADVPLTLDELRCMPVVSTNEDLFCPGFFRTRNCCTYS